MVHGANPEPEDRGDYQLRNPVGWHLHRTVAMNPLTPIVGAGWSEPTQSHVENSAEQNSRFHSAQSRQLFAWSKCQDCGELYRRAAGHQCKQERQ